MVNLHKELLTENANRQFKKLINFYDEFYLAGGTALALQIGHRVSLDLDFFSEKKIKKTLLSTIEKIFSGAPIVVLLDNSRELTLLVDEVKYTFLHYPFPVLEPLIITNDIKLLSVKEILATKAYSIGRRGSFKDYIDLYIGLKQGYANLAEIIALACKKYSDTFNDRLFLEQLLFLDDVEEIEVIMQNGAMPKKNELLRFFSDLISKERENLTK